MPDILQTLPLADEIVEALLTHEGMMGATLRCVLAYERGDWETVQNLGCRRDLLVKTYLEALMWTTEMHNTF
jgi:c-di-GMP-related signal transduction protein